MPSVIKHLLTIVVAGYAQLPTSLYFIAFPFPLLLKAVCNLYIATSRSQEKLHPISTTSSKITYTENTMKLESCIDDIIHQDESLTNIIIRPTCLIACSNYEPNRSNENNDNFDGLTTEHSGSREWFCTLGVMIGRLSNLTQLTFDGLNPDNENLEQFWGEISNSTSLTDLYFINMNLVSCEEILATINAPNIKSITFKCCTSIPNEIGYILHQQGQDKLINHLATLVFTECSFNNTNTIREIVHFATELANLTSIKSFLFTSCSFDIEQSMCLLRCLNEETVNQVDVQIT